MDSEPIEPSPPEVTWRTSRWLVVALLASAPISVGNATAPDTICRARSVTHAMPAGAWAGGCAGGIASGHGAMRVTGPNGRGVFAGRADAGRPQSGVTILERGDFFPLAPEVSDPPAGMDAASMANDHAFLDAYAGAMAASEVYRRAGNVSSARYYRALRIRLERGRIE